MQKNTFFLFLLFCSSGLFGQVTLPSYGDAFPQDQMSRVDIYIHPDSFALMYADVIYGNSHYFPATFVFSSSVLHDSIPNVGFRLHGNTSLNAQKKSFSVSFDEFQNGSWQSLQKVNFLGQANDPSLLRSKLCHDTFRHFGIASSRTSYSNLYINGTFAGVYLEVEQIDKAFCKKYFDHSGDGNLYKCTYPAPLQFVDNNPTSYQALAWGNRPYDLKNNEWKDDYTDLAHFIDVLNNTSISNLPCELEKVFAVDDYLKTAAIDVLTGNWDNYIYNKNNFYLYKDQATGQFHYMPYDLDNTLGIDWLGQDWSTRNIYNWAPSGDARPLYSRILQVTEYKNRFSYYIYLFKQNYFTETNISGIAQQWQSMIHDAAVNDTFRPLDFGFTVSDFENAITEAWGNQVAFGIGPYVSARVASAQTQLQTFSVPNTNITSISALQPLHAGDMTTTFDVFITDSLTANGQIKWSEDGVSYAALSSVNQSGNHLSTDFIYTGTSDKLYYKSQIGSSEIVPCTGDFLWATESASALFINEVMPINQTTLSDESGSFEDWCELYNGGTFPINLTGYFLTDEGKFNNNKWPLPNVTINPGAFFLIWLDSDPATGNNHSSFKLGSADSTLTLYSTEQGKPRFVDELSCYNAMPDSSYSRIPNGSSNLVWTANSTPNASNNTTGLVELPKQGMLLFPVPANDVIYCTDFIENGVVLDLSGREIMTFPRTKSIDISGLSVGMYLLKTKSQRIPFVVK